MGAAPIAARSLTLTSTPHQPAHSGSRSTIAGRIASHAATRSLPGTGAPSSPTCRPEPASPATSSPSGALVAATRSAKRPIGRRMRTCGRPATVVSWSRCQPRRANSLSLRGLDLGLEPQHAGGLGAGARGTDQRGPHPHAGPSAGRRGDDEAAARPPAEVGARRVGVDGGRGGPRRAPRRRRRGRRARSRAGRGRARRGRPRRRRGKRPCSSTKTARRSARWATTSGWRASIAGASVIVTSWGRRRARPPRISSAALSPNAWWSRIDTDLSPPPRTAPSTRRTPRTRRPGRRRACRRPRGPWRRGR